MLRRLLLDPIAIKELSGTARRWQTYAGRGLYVAVFGLVLWSYSDNFIVGGAWKTQSDYAQLGRQLFTSFFGFQFLLVTLSSVSAASDLVTKEVRAGTLSILTCSPLTPWNIALGKWKAAFAQAGTLLLCGSPILAFCVYLGGATPRDLAYSTGLSLAAAALGAATALYCSTLFRSGVTALLVSCAALAVYTFLPAAYPSSWNFGELPRVLSPYLHLVDAADVAMHPQRKANKDFEMAWISAVVVTFLIVWQILRRTAARIAALALVTPGPSLLSRIFAGLDRFYEGLGPERFRGIRLLPSREGVWETRAVLWKELQTRASGRLRNSVRISLVLLLSLAISFSVNVEFMALPVLVSTALLWLLALSNGASLFVTEKEERKWDILLATPLTSSEILTAKLMAGVVPVIPTATTVTLFWTAIHFTHGLDSEYVVIVLSSIFMPAALAYALGALCSLKAHSLRGAFLTSFSLLFTLMAALPLLQSFKRGHVDESGWYSPLASVVWLSDRGFSYWHRTVPESLLSNAVILIGLYALMIAVTLVYLFERFDRISGRSE
jgi:ABC-type transport system involved in multi-copper enzyme maturation permease subunit